MASTSMLQVVSVSAGPSLPSSSASLCRRGTRSVSSSQCSTLDSDGGRVGQRRLTLRILRPAGALVIASGKFSRRNCGQDCQLLSTKRTRGNWSRTMSPRWKSGNRTTMALPLDGYWITAAEAVTITVLMGGSAALAGVFINIKIEEAAVKEWLELEAKGMLPENLPDGDYDPEGLTYVLGDRLSVPRNRPVREEYAPKQELELQTELQTESQMDLQTKLQTDLQTKLQTDLQTELQTELLTELKAEMQPDHLTDLRTELKTELQPELEPAFKE